MASSKRPQHKSLETLDHGFWHTGLASRLHEEVEWDWTKFPVCNVYNDANHHTVPVTVAAYDKRLQQLNNFIQNTLPADIYAFEEVSGESAVREALPNHGAGYEICTFPDFKVQRLAIAWKSEFGAASACTVEPALSLPDNPDADRPRPGLSVDLMIDGTPLRVLAVHLKSGCVSPLEASGDLTHDQDRDCRILQQQIVPIEKWVEGQFSGSDKVIMLGDFNRNFWHERNYTVPSALTEARHRHHCPMVFWQRTCSLKSSIMIRPSPP